MPDLSAWAGFTTILKQLPGGLTGAGVYQPPVSIYNATPASMGEIRAAIAKARTGTQIQIACVGDSTMAGQFLQPSTQSPPVALRKILAASNDVPAGGTGIVLCDNYCLPADSRWSFAGAWVPFIVAALVTPFYEPPAAAATATFISDIAGTSVSVYYGNSGGFGQFTVAIDGAAAVPVNPTATNTVGIYTVNGLANTVHTVVMTYTAGQWPNLLMGCDVYTPGVGARIHNLGLGGARLQDWTNTNWYNAAAVAKALACDINLIQLEVNDAEFAMPPATYLAGLQTLATYLGNAVLVTGYPPNPAGVTITQAQWNALNQAVFAVADALNLPLLHVTDRFGGLFSVANALGLMADAAHPSAAGCAAAAAGLAELLTA
jgi:lysophospholipase L1-like esterase